MTFSVAKAVQLGNHIIVEKGFQQANYSSASQSVDAGFSAYTETFFNNDQKHLPESHVAYSKTAPTLTTTPTPSSVTATKGIRGVTSTGTASTTTSSTMTTVNAVQPQLQQPLSSSVLLHPPLVVTSPVQTQRIPSSCTLVSEASHTTHPLILKTSHTLTQNSSPSTSFYSQSFSPTSTDYSTTSGPYSLTPSQPLTYISNTPMNAGATNPYVRNIFSPFNGNRSVNHNTKHKFMNNPSSLPSHKSSPRSLNNPSSPRSLKSMSSQSSSPQSYSISSQSSRWFSPYLSVPSSFSSSTSGYSSSTQFSPHSTQNILFSSSQSPHTSSQRLFLKNVDDRKVSVVNVNQN